MPDGALAAKSAEFRPFPQAFLDEVKARTPLAMLIGRRVRMEPAGRDHKACCPLHGEKTASLHVYADHYHCFGCGAHGDCFDWLHAIENLTFQDAVAQLAAEAGMRLPDHVNRAHRESGKANGTKPPKPADDEGEWLPQVPPPRDAPSPTEQQLRCDMLHEYRDAEDTLLFYVRRIEARGGRRKEFWPLTYGYLREKGKSEGLIGWHQRAPSTPRPLWRLNRLAGNPDARVIICEGEKAADAAQRLLPDAVCMTWMGGSGAVEKADWAPLRHCQTEVIIWPDNDTAGHKAAAEIAKILPAARVLRVNGLFDGYDAADLEAEISEDPEAWLRERLPSEAPSERKSILRAFSMDEIGAIKPADYLIKGLINRNEMSVIVGEPKCGKSFFTMFLGYRIAQGQSVFGRRVRPGRVLYLAAEGEHGIAKRLRALRDRYGDTANFRFVAQPIDLLHRDAGHFDALLELAQEFQPDLIVVDTLNRALGGGSENAPEDMGGFIMNMSALRHETRAHIAIIHHGTKSSGGTNPRGHGSLTGADDLLLEITKAEDGSRVATVVHARDEADDYRMGFTLDQVELGLDDDGDAITTLVARALPEAAQAGGKAKRKLHEEAETLRREIENELAAGYGRMDRPEPGMPEVPTLNKACLVAGLIRSGWLRVSGNHDLETPNGNSETGTVPKEEHIRLWKRLNTLKLHGIIGCNRYKVWWAQKEIPL